jgi:hypothetical protein
VLLVVSVPWKFIENFTVALAMGLFPASASRPDTANEAGARKFEADVAVPDGVVTAIGPVVTPFGTVATISVVDFKMKEADTPLNVTALGVMKFVP